MEIINESFYNAITILTSVVAYAGEWIAVDGGTSTINVE